MKIPIKKIITKMTCSKDSKKVKYIIPPGLHKAFEEFVVHCEIAQTQPMMVVGGTGVGKSMFLDVFKKLYEESCKKKEKNPMSYGPTAPTLEPTVTKAAWPDRSSSDMLMGHLRERKKVAWRVLFKELIKGCLFLKK